MSAERLREAAGLMRERARAATPGPWWGEGVWWEHWTDAEGRACHTPFPLVGHGHLGTAIIARVASSDEDRAHIASMHPAVALAVADWLDAEADVDQLARSLGGRGLTSESHAVIVADAYLGTTNV